MGNGFKLAEAPIVPFTMPIGDSRILEVKFSPTKEGKMIGKLKLKTNVGEYSAPLLGFGRKAYCSCSSSGGPLNSAFNIILMIIPLLIRKITKRWL